MCLYTIYSTKGGDLQQQRVQTFLLKYHIKVQPTWRTHTESSLSKSFKYQPTRNQSETCKNSSSCIGFMVVVDRVYQENHLHLIASCILMSLIAYNPTPSVDILRLVDAFQYKEHVHWSSIKLDTACRTFCLLSTS